MFKNSKAFSSFSVDDIEKAKEFYGQTLGLEVAEDEMGVLAVNLADGNWVMVYPKGDGHTPATFTVLNFPVDNIGTAIDELTSKGVTLEHYDDPDFKTNERGIASFGERKMAWFTDPAGNILSLIQDKTS